MKIKKLITGAILATTLMLGVGVGVASLANKKGEAEPATAASSAEEIFINTAGISDWESGAETMAWVSGGGQTNKWIMTTWISNNIRKFTLPANYTTVTVCRFSSSNHPADQSTYWWDDNWGQAWDFTPGETLNYMSLTGWSDGKASYSTGYVKHFTSGQKVYVDIQGNESWWFDTYKTYFYAAVGNMTSWTQLSRIGSSNMLSATFSSDVYADLAIFVRNSSASWTGKTDQTDDIIYTSSNVSCNAFKLGVVSGNVPVTGMEVFSDAYVADSFGYYFLQQGICKDAGGLTNNATTLWSNASSVYTSLKALLSNQNYIKNGSSSGDLNINRALLRYDTALAKNPTVLTNNFIGRTVSGNGRAIASIFGNDTATTSSIAIVVVASLVAVSVVSGYFFLRRRKEN